MRRFFDRLASFLAAIATFAIAGGPVWFTIKAVRSEIAPIWAYGFAAALGIVGVVLTLAFLRKGVQGVAPTRMRKR